MALKYAILNPILEELDREGRIKIATRRQRDWIALRK
jgi:hypothetical protein